MSKIIAMFLFICAWAFWNMLIAVEGQKLPAGKYAMPKILRKIVFYLPRIYYKFTRRGIVLSMGSHILLVASVAILFLSQENWNELADVLFWIWIIGILGLIIVLDFGYCGLLLFGDKKYLKKNNMQTKKTAVVEFNESDIIIEAVVSKPDVSRGLLVMIPTSVTLDYKGTFPIENEDEYIGTYGNYELMSDILVGEGYTTVRFNIKQRETDGFFDYTKELKRKLQEIIDKEGYDRISFLSHGPIGSVTVLEIMEDFKVDRMLMLGGANVTPYDDLTGFIRFNREKITIDEFVET